MLGHDRRSLRVGDKEKHEASIRRASYSATVHRTKCSRVLRRLLRVTVLPVSRLDTFYLIFFSLRRARERRYSCGSPLSRHYNAARGQPQCKISEQNNTVHNAAPPHLVSYGPRDNFGRPHHRLGAARRMDKQVNYTQNEVDPHFSCLLRERQLQKERHCINKLEKRRRV